MYERVIVLHLASNIAFSVSTSAAHFTDKGQMIVWSFFFMLNGSTPLAVGRGGGAGQSVAIYSPARTGQLPNFRRLHRKRHDVTVGLYSSADGFALLRKTYGPNS